MKGRPLNNPALVALLAIAAIIAAGYNVSRSFRRPVAKPPASSVSGPLPAPAAPAGPGHASATPASMSAADNRPRLRTLDAVHFAGWFPRWIEGPVALPFGKKDIAKGDTNAAILPDMFQVEAIWIQSGDALAVLDGKIVAVGDGYQGFTVAAIGTNSVTLNGSKATFVLRSLSMPETQGPASPAP